MLVYLLVEESFRELASRQLIAHECVARGLDVVVAQQWWFSENCGRLPPGVVLFKGNNLAQARIIQSAKQHGFRIATIEEEAFGITYEPEVASLFHPASVESADVLLLQGNIHAELVRRLHPRAAERIAVVGNPRTDILLSALGEAPRHKAEALRDKYGEFVLVNTNHAGANPREVDALSVFQRCVDVGIVDPSRPEDTHRFDSLIAWERDNLREMARFVRLFSERVPNHRIVLRPHPSENGRRWSHRFAGDSRVTVVQDHDHVAWLLAASVSVHTSCTTGLESVLLGTPAIGICPGTHDWHAGFISNIVSDVRTTAAAAVEATLDHLTGSAEAPRLDTVRDRLRPALEIDAGKRASQRIASVLADLAGTFPSGRPDPGMAGHGISIGRSRLSGHRHRKAFVELRTFSATWKSILTAIDSGLDVDIGELAPSVFHLRRSGVTRPDAGRADADRKEWGDADPFGARPTMREPARRPLGSHVTTAPPIAEAEFESEVKERAMALWRDGNVSGAIDLLTSAVDHAPTDAALRQTLAAARAAAGDTEAALGHARSSLILSPSDRRSTALLASLPGLEARGEVRWIARLGVADPLHPMPRLRRVREGLASGISTPDETRRATIASPEMADCWALHGLAQGLIGAYADGLEWLDRAAILAPRVGLTRYHAARLAFLMDDQSKAEARVRAALDLGHAPAETAFLLGRILRATERLEAAAAAFDRAVSLDRAFANRRRIVDMSATEADFSGH